MSRIQSVVRVPELDNSSVHGVTPRPARPVWSPGFVHDVGTNSWSCAFGAQILHRFPEANPAVLSIKRSPSSDRLAALRPARVRASKPSSLRQLDPEPPRRGRARPSGRRASRPAAIYREARNPMGATKTTQRRQPTTAAEREQRAIVHRRKDRGCGSPGSWMFSTVPLWSWPGYCNDPDGIHC